MSKHTASQDRQGKAGESEAPGPLEDGQGATRGGLVEWVTSQPPDGLPNVSVQAPTPSSLWQKT